MHNQVY
jgi:hypothetical protein